MKKQPQSQPGLVRRFRVLLAEPIDGASLAAFRICFGLVMFWHTVKFLWPQSGASLAQLLYVDAPFNFSYPGFGWVQPWPEPFLTLHLVVLALAAACVAAGLCYRAASIFLLVGYTYVFLIEAATYNNHNYLMCLVALLLAVMPAQRRFSIDAWRHARRGRAPTGALAKTVPFWTIFALRAQVTIMYFYGGIAKINSDWLTGIPLISPAKVVSGAVGGSVSSELIGLTIAWIGLIFDLLIVPLLICRRTRVLGIVLTFIFHFCNYFLFPIGVFPAMAFMSTLVFFEPDWPVRVYRWIKRPRVRAPELGWLVGGACAIPVVGAALGWKCAAAEPLSPSRATPCTRWLLRLVCCWLAFQLIFPLRHFAIDGDANWTEEGQDFSWRMMLRSKGAGHVLNHVTDPELHVVDANGNEQIDWDRWPAGRPRGIYVPIDCRRFNWDHHPGLTVTYEPGLGQRFIYCPSAAEASDVDWRVAAETQINETWSQAFGRKPQIRDTISLQEALRASQAVVGDMPRDSAENSALALREALDLLAADYPVDTVGDEKRWSTVGGLAQHLLRDDNREDFPELRRVHPFATQGADFGSKQFLVIEDAAIDDTEKATACQRLSRTGPFLVWIDLSRLHPETWRGLPDWFVSFENRNLRIVWNHFKELNRVQRERFAVRPYMIHQYAQHIARRWERETGRFPEVRTHSNIMLNYHHPQALIDPSVDLTKTPYKMMRHNRWILPLELNRPAGVPPTHR